MKPPARPRSSGTRAAAAALAWLCLLAGCDAPRSPPGTDAAAARTVTAAAPAGPRAPLVLAARQQIGVTVRYDPAYVRIAYPGGDVPIDRGVCTDVVIRALRLVGTDVQVQVHRDMLAHPEAYPRHWGQHGPDASIDHRRVPNLQAWFDRQGWTRPVSPTARDYAPGDLVTWNVSSRLPHIGIVSDRRDAQGTPLIIHNIGQGTREDNVLFAYPITGHYRPAMSSPTASSTATGAG